ncbi:MAG: 5-amino-6-(D-ribitylamino)uracil--L-tyrosine 4-hydroxyphenyl transferase CofH [Polyangia bacterium]
MLLELLRRLDGQPLSDEVALQLADVPRAELAPLFEAAAAVRDRHYGRRVSFSPKVFLPLTNLCRNHCDYCSFRRSPGQPGEWTMTPDEVEAAVVRAREQGCVEALFCLGDKPEGAFSAYRRTLAGFGLSSTVEYLHRAGELALRHGLLPHTNAGVLSAADMERLKPVNVSLGLMLENISPRLCEPGMPHHRAPDKRPARRVRMLEEAGQLKIPFTTGILLGIGETRRERIESLLAIRALHRAHGHIQEVIVQNFRARPEIPMHAAPEPEDYEVAHAVAMARLILDLEVSVQAPPNLNPASTELLLRAGLNDFGGISPVTPDYINPGHPWPHLDAHAEACGRLGFTLYPRLPIYERYLDRPGFLADELRAPTRAAQVRLAAQRLPGRAAPPFLDGTSAGIRAILERCLSGHELSVADALPLCRVEGQDLAALCQTADALRREQAGDVVTYVVNRNINFTNVCVKACRFCAFSRTQRSEEGYFLDEEEVVRRAVEAHALGATEVCIQAGLAPGIDGEHYIRLCRAIKRAAPSLHLHAFSPEEIKYGAGLAKLSFREYLQALKEAGLGSLPGTSAEVLDDAVRARIAPGRITTAEWMDVIRSAHAVGLPTTSTLMFGHIETDEQRLRHLDTLRTIQHETKGFTEFVPLSFVHEEAPMTVRKLIPELRPGPSRDDVTRLYAIARLMLGPSFRNIQVSWVKQGLEHARELLACGVNDLGGTLINESISTAAGAGHGQFVSPAALRRTIRAAGRVPAERSTSYRILREYTDEPEAGDALDGIADPEARFGSYAALTQDSRYRFIPLRRSKPTGPASSA